MILELFFRGFWSAFLDIFGNCELVKISVSLKRELDFQGLAGFGSACFVLFFGVRFPDGFGNEFLLILEWFWAPFCLPKSLKTSSISASIFGTLKKWITLFGKRYFGHISLQAPPPRIS